MNKTIEQVELEAGKKIPREEVSLRDGGGGKKLSYLEAHYVIQRMNDVFGVCGWDQEVIEMRQVNSTESKPSYIAKVRLTATVKTEDHATNGGYMRVVKEDYGFGSDKSGLNPHEMASKEAVSDAFKRAARQFGMSLGLALYSKDQENVEDAAKPAPANTGSIKAAYDKHEPAMKALAPNDNAPAKNRDILNKKITAIARVCINKGKYTKESFQAMRKEKYGVDSTEALSDTQATELNAALEKLAEAK